MLPTDSMQRLSEKCSLRAWYTCHGTRPESSTRYHTYFNFVSGLPNVRPHQKIEQAFVPGYDPVLELANNNRNHRNIIQHLRRKEQDAVDNIIGGREPGHYFLLIGSKVVVASFRFYAWRPKPYPINALYFPMGHDRDVERGA